MRAEDIQPLTPDQLSTLANPLRQRILELLCRQELTAGGIRDRLGEAPSNLYYHLEKLQACGLIEVVATERKRGAVEKTLRAIAPGFTVPSELLVVGAGKHVPAILDVVRTMQESCLRKLGDSFRRGLSGPAAEDQDTEAGSRATRLEVPMINSCTVRTSPARMRRLRSRMDRLVGELLEEEAPDDGAVVEATLLQLFFLTDAGSPADDETDRDE